MNKPLFVVICFLFFSANLSAATAAYEIDTLLQTNAVTYGQAARFILEASGNMVFADGEAAFRYALEKNWLSGSISAGQTARLDVISRLFMNAFEIKGGIFYTITGRPWYAYRELVYLGFIQGRTEPGMNVSGELLLFITSRILTNHPGVVQ
jgi:hypothetical protein